MMKSEFENLAGREVTDEQYRAIETLYMSSNLEKTEFVKSMKPILKNIPQPERKKDIKRMVVRDRSGYRKTPNGYEKWHTDRMQNLGCTDLMNPYQNVRVGIDFLSYLLKKYGTIQDTLAAYNYGEKGAREYLWNNGVYVYSYNTAIMQRMKEIEEVVGK